MSEFPFVIAEEEHWTRYAYTPEGMNIETAPIIIKTSHSSRDIPFTTELIVEDGDISYDQFRTWRDQNTDGVDRQIYVEQDLQKTIAAFRELVRTFPCFNFANESVDYQQCFASQYAFTVLTRTQNLKSFSKVMDKIIEFILPLTVSEFLMSCQLGNAISHAKEHGNLFLDRVKQVQECIRVARELK